MKNQKEMDKVFRECIEDMKKPITDLSEKYPTPLINGAMIELGLRMAMIQGGSYHTIRIFAGVMHNISTFGQLMEKDIAEAIRSGEKPDPFDDWEYSGIKKTLH